jgi:hypothetical protein
MPISNTKVLWLSRILAAGKLRNSSVLSGILLATADMELNAEGSTDVMSRGVEKITQGSSTSNERLSNDRFSANRLVFYLVYF